MQIIGNKNRGKHFPFPQLGKQGEFYSAKWNFSVLRREKNVDNRVTNYRPAYRTVGGGTSSTFIGGTLWDGVWSYTERNLSQDTVHLPVNH